MSHKLVSFIVFVWFMGQILSLMVEGSFIGSDDSGLLNDLLIFNSVEQTSEGGIWEFAKAGPGFLRGILKMVVWDYSYLQDEMSILRYVLMVFSMGLIVQFIALFMGAARGVLSFVRP